MINFINELNTIFFLNCRLHNYLKVQAIIINESTGKLNHFLSLFWSCVSFYNTDSVTTTKSRDVHLLLNEIKCVAKKYFMVGSWLNFGYSSLFDNLSLSLFLSSHLFGQASSS